MDDENRVIWLSYMHKGGYHDFNCLRETKLYTKLHKVKDHIYTLGYFIAGGSAYAL